MTHTVLTFISRVKPDKVKELAALLQQIQDRPANNAIVPFGNLKTLHFASFVLHEPAKAAEKEKYGFRLVFENNFDGSLDPYLDDLCDKVGPGLHRIYLQCQDYPAADASDREGLKAYLKSCVVRPNAYHIGNTGRAAPRITDERTFRDTLELRADELVIAGKPSSASELFNALRNFADTTPPLSQLKDPGPRQNFFEHYWPWLNLVVQGLIAIAFIVLLFPLVIILALVLFYKEKTDSVNSGAADDANIRKLVASEDHTTSVQNHMASITTVKDGWLRRRTLWLVLWAVNLLARANATHGQLSGIPSIHFAHWSMIDGGQRLLFLSNFDGSWENYLDDFIDKAHTGLTAVWSNTVDFPRTQYLINGGATDGPRFKAVARDSQTVTNAWYSAYRDLTVQGIDNNSSIREELRTPQTDAQSWLHRL